MSAVINLSEERRLQAHAFAADLACLNWPAARTQVANAGSLLTAELVGLLIALSRDNARVDKSSCLKWAALGVVATETAICQPAVRECAALSWSTLANAHRATGDLTRAATALTISRRYIPCATDPLSKAQVLQDASSIYEHQRNFKSALRAIRRAEGYLQTAQPHLIGECKIRRGKILASAGEYAPAIAELVEGLELVQPRAQTFVVLSAIHAIIYCLAEVGEVDQALRTLRRVREIYHLYGGRIEQVRLRWLEARILRTLGLSSASATVLAEVVSAFAELGLKYDVALATIELAEARAGLGQWGAAEVAAQHAIVLCSGVVERETLAALGLLAEAVRRRQVDSSVVRWIVQVAAHPVPQMEG